MYLTYLREYGVKQKLVGVLGPGKQCETAILWHFLHVYAFFTHATNLLAFFTEFERIFHISVKFACNMFHESVIFQSHATHATETAFFYKLPRSRTSGHKT